MVQAGTLVTAFSGIIGVIIGAVGGAVGSYIVMREREKRITERRRAGTYFDNQAEHLLNLYSELRSCFDTLNKYANKASGGAITQQEYINEIKPAVASFEDTLRQSELFLTEDEYDEIQQVFAVFARTELYLNWKMNNPNSSNPPAGKNMDWVDFLDTHNETRERLREIIRERYAEVE